MKNQPSGKIYIILQYLPARNIVHLQLETLCASNHTACCFAEKTRFFRAPWAGALRRRLALSLFQRLNALALPVKDGGDVLWQVTGESPRNKHFVSHGLRSAERLHTVRRSPEKGAKIFCTFVCQLVRTGLLRRMVSNPAGWCRPFSPWYPARAFARFVVRSWGWHDAGLPFLHPENSLRSFSHAGGQLRKPGREAAPRSFFREVTFPCSPFFYFAAFPASLVFASRSSPVERTTFISICTKFFEYYFFAV